MNNLESFWWKWCKPLIIIIIFNSNIWCQVREQGQVNGFQYPLFFLQPVVDVGQESEQDPLVLHAAWSQSRGHSVVRACMASEPVASSRTIPLVSLTSTGFTVRWCRQKKNLKNHCFRVFSFGIDWLFGFLSFNYPSASESVCLGTPSYDLCGGSGGQRVCCRKKNVEIKRPGGWAPRVPSRTRPPGFHSQPHLSWVVWLWGSYLPSQCLSFPIYKNDILIIPTS